MTVIGQRIINIYWEHEFECEAICANFAHVKKNNYDKDYI